MADDIIFSLGGDASSSITAIENVISAITKLQEAFDKLQSSLTIFDDISQKLDQTAVAIDNVDSAVRSVGTSLEALKLIQGEVDITIADATTALDNMATASQATGDTLTLLDESLNTTAEDATLAGDALALSFQKVFDDAGPVQDSLDAITLSAEDAFKAMLADADASMTLDEAFQLLNEDGRLDATTLADVAAAEDALAKAALNAATQTDILVQQTSGLAQILTTTGSNILDEALDVDAFRASLKDATDQIVMYITGIDDMALAQAELIASETENVAAQGELATAAGETDAALAEQSDFFSADAMNLVMLTTAILAATTALGKMGMEAQTSISRIVGLADPTLQEAKNSGELKQVIDALEQSSMKFGVTLKDAADGMYYIESAGFSTKDSLTILNYSMETAAATGTKMQIVSNALTSVMKDYNINVKDAGDTTNIMIEAVVKGKQSFEDFANVIGPLSAAASRAGVSFKELAAAESTMTQLNPRVRQDGQNLAALMRVLSDDFDKVAKVAKTMGTTLNRNSFEALPLIDKLQLLAKIAKGDTTPAFRQLLLNATSTSAAFMLLSNNGDNYRKNLDAMNHSQKALNDAYKAFESTVQASADKIKAALSVIAYEFLQMVTPATKKVLDEAAALIKKIADNMDALKPIILGVAVFISVLLVGSIIALIGYLLTLIGPLLIASSAAMVVATAVFYFHEQVTTLIWRINGLFPGFALLVGAMMNVAMYIEDIFLAIWKKLVDEFGILKQWIEEHVIPPLKKIVDNLIILATTLVQKIIPGLKQLKNEFEPLGKFIMTTVVPAIGKLIDKFLEFAVYVSGHIPQIVQKLVQDLQKIGEVVLKVGGIISAIRIGVLVNQFLAWAKAAEPLAAVLLRLAPIIANIAEDVAALLNPVGLAAAVILLLAGYFLQLVQDAGKMPELLKSFTDQFKMLGEEVKKQLGDTWKQLAKTWNEDLKPALKDLKPLFDALGDAIKFLAIIVGGSIVVGLGILLALLGGIAAIVGKVAQGLTQTLGGAIKFVTGVIQANIDIIKMFFDITRGDLTSLQKDWKDFGDKVKDILDGLGKVLLGLWNATLGAIIAGVGQFAKQIIKFFMDLADMLVGHSIVPDMLNKIVKAFADFPQKVIDVVKKWSKDIQKEFTDLADKLVGHSIVPDMLNKILSLFQEAPDKVGKVVQDLADKVTKIFNVLATDSEKIGEDIINNLVQGITSTTSAAVQAVQDLVKNIKDTFSKMIQDAKQWGTDMMNGFGKGMEQAGQAVVQQAMSIAQQVASYLHFSRPDVGPLKDYEEWMPHFGEGLAQGLNAQVGKVGLAAANVAMSISTAAPTTDSLSNYSSANSNTTVTEQTMVLREILQELKNANKNSQGSSGRGYIGYDIPSTELGAVNQQFTLNSPSSASSATTLYNQINTLGGLAAEYGARGSSSGLGF